ncbi:MAG: RNA polymerase sigma-54 factor, partial [Brucella anthropi]
MALSPKLDFRQSQSLVMTPQLMQSIKLLQMTHMELEQFLDIEIEKNPLLDRIEAANDDFSGAESARDGAEIGGEDAASDDSPDGDWFKTGASDNAENLSSTFDSSLENIFPDDPGRFDEIGPDLAAQWKSSVGDGYVSGGSYDIDQVTASRISLSEHVAEQITLTFSKAADRFIATALADALDESGYLRVDIVGLAQNLGVETVEIERVLGVMQGFDPAGLFARDLRECLAIQLRLKDRFDPAMEVLIDNLDLLARRDFATLKKLCGVDQADILDMLTEIRMLDPKPGALFEISVADA